MYFILHKIIFFMRHVINVTRFISIVVTVRFLSVPDLFCSFQSSAGGVSPVVMGELKPSSQQHFKMTKVQK